MTQSVMHDPPFMHGAGTPGLGMDALALLREGELEVRGRLTVSSNAALVGTIALATPAGEPDRRLGGPGGLLDHLLGDDEPGLGQTIAAAVYKPVAFERPLWDFPDGTLANREVAAFLVSEATGWGIVPPTVLRDGPAGLGMVQLWIDEDETIDAWEMVQTDDDRLRPMALFDAVVNNTDRKGSHILPVRRPVLADRAMADHRRAAGERRAAVSSAGRATARADSPVHLFGVDHGVCFSEDPKLRTVLWAWRSTPIAEPYLDVLRRLRHAFDGELGRDLGDLLAPEEVAATRRRLDDLLASGLYPEPDPDWPAVPWPPY